MTSILRAPSRHDDASSVEGNAPATPTNDSDTGRHHRRDIQGMRALAVIVVLLFHGGGWLPGGYVGVDMFFVISGFVITLLLMREWAENGRIDLVQFAVRRFRRLSPPLAITVAITLLISLVVASPLGQMQMIGATALGAMLFVGNLAVLKTSAGYFHPAAETNPLLHTWSLSVEEQFYFVFPLLLLVAYVIGRRLRWRWTPIAIVGAATVVSFAITMLPYVGVQLPAHRTPQTVFYSPVTRVWEFGIGSLLALAGPAAQLTRRLSSIAAAVLSLAALTWCMFAFTSSTNHPGPITVVPVLATALLIAASADAASPQARLLGSRPMHWIGDRSYGWYLWHWPAIVFVAGSLTTNRVVLLAVSLSTVVLAMATYRWIEQPMRVRNPLRFPRTSRLVLVSLGVPALMAGALWIGVREGFGNSTVQAYQADILPAHSGAARGCDNSLLEPVWRSDTCTWRPASAPAADAPWLYLVGDSHADHFSETMLGVADTLGRPLRIATAQACPFTGVTVARGGGQIFDIGCRDYNVELVDFLVEQPPGTVVISNSNAYWSSTDSGAGYGDDLTFDTEAKRRLLRESAEALVRRLEQAGHQVLVVHTVPDWSLDTVWAPLHCTLFDITGGDCRASMSLDESTAQRSIERELIREAVEAGGGTMIEARDVLCRDGVCPTERDGVILYRDDNHISRRAGEMLVPLFADTITSER